MQQYNEFDIKKLREILNNDKFFTYLEETGMITQGQFMGMHPLDYLHYKYKDGSAVSCNKAKSITVYPDNSMPYLSEVIKCLS